MEPTLRAALLSWDVRPELLFVLLLAGGLYVRGWRRLRTLSAGRAYTGWRLASYLLGLTFIGLALMSPIDVLALQLFSLHMLQHVILMGWAPPLLWL
ncbi:MAG: cytochrome c oxidase assembly protein, partial [Candidatus Promineifilaceae bacterium]